MLIKAYCRSQLIRLLVTTLKNNRHQIAFKARHVTLDSNFVIRFGHNIEYVA